MFQPAAKAVAAGIGRLPFEQLGGLGRSFRAAWSKQSQLLTQVGNRQEARDRALEAISPDLHRQLAQIFVTLLRISNGSGVDLESAYLKSLQVAGTEEIPGDDTKFSQISPAEGER